MRSHSEEGEPLLLKAPSQKISLVGSLAFTPTSSLSYFPDQVPQDIIWVIASFLEIAEVIKLAQVNKRLLDVLGKMPINIKQKDGDKTIQLKDGIKFFKAFKVKEEALEDNILPLRNSFYIRAPKSCLPVAGFMPWGIGAAGGAAGAAKGISALAEVAGLSTTAGALLGGTVGTTICCIAFGLGFAQAYKCDSWKEEKEQMLTAKNNELEEIKKAPVLLEMRKG